MANVPKQRSTTRYPDLRHDGIHGRREECWRAECAPWAAAGYRMILILETGEILAFCHKARFDARVAA